MTMSGRFSPFPFNRNRARGLPYGRLYAIPVKDFSKRAFHLFNLNGTQKYATLSISFHETVDT